MRNWFIGDCGQAYIWIAADHRCNLERFFPEYSTPRATICQRKLFSQIVVLTDSSHRVLNAENPVFLVLLLDVVVLAVINSGCQNTCQYSTSTFLMSMLCLPCSPRRLLLLLWLLLLLLSSTRR